jgi:hypothetical protein
VKKISQREAHRLQGRVRKFIETEFARSRTWNRDYPGGVNICTEPNVTGSVKASIETAAKLGYYVIAKIDGDTIRFYAVKP